MMNSESAGQTRNTDARWQAPPSPRVLAVPSYKGGVGKSTTALALAAGLAHKGRRVLLIDMDAQANSTKVLLKEPPPSQLPVSESVYVTVIERGRLPVFASRLPGLSIAPAHERLADADVRLSRQETENAEEAGRLATALRAVDHQAFDHLVIDCPPSLGWLTVNALAAADAALIVTAPGYFEVDSMARTLSTIEATRRFYNPRLIVEGILFTMTDQTRVTTRTLALLRSLYGPYLLPITIPRNTDVREAAFAKMDIFSYNPHASASLAYAQLVEEVYHG